MGKKLAIEALVDGGKASAGPPIGPAVGPTGIPLANVIKEVNSKTADFKGLKVPVVIELDLDDKTFEVKVRTPMTSALLIKEAGVEKGSGEPNVTKVADLTLDSVCKVARMKRDDISAIEFSDAVRVVLGTAQSCGFTVDGMEPVEMQKLIKSGEVKVKE